MSGPRETRAVDAFPSFGMAARARSGGKEGF